MKSKVNKKAASSQFAGYNVAGVRVEGSPYVRYIYFREHVSKVESEELPRGRTLFVTNIPALSPVEVVCKVFESCGKIERVTVGTFKQGGDAGSAALTDTLTGNINGLSKQGSVERPNSFIHLVFKSEKAMTKLESLCADPVTVSAKTVQRSGLPSM
eukprot:GFYU01015723.1.p1 GENE.GFYU01015723.1~~GFYU01015723.1.p1  ORF type:complete len:157 (-),score=15.18 GFYU01015723.1:565-1035(-)